MTIPGYLLEQDAGDKEEDVDRGLHERAFTDFAIATGHGAERFAVLFWLKVAGTPPGPDCLFSSGNNIFE